MNRVTMTTPQAADAAARGDLVTITEAAHLLQIPARTVRTWMDRGHLPATRAAGPLRVDLAAASDLEHARRTARHADRTAPGGHRAG